METRQELLNRLSRLAEVKQDAQCPTPSLIRRLEGWAISFSPAVLASEAAVARSLADPTRLKILHLLAEERDFCACEVQTVIRESQPLTSHHLRALRKAGLVKSRRSGTWVYYRLASGKLRMILKALRELAQGDTELVLQEHLRGR